MRNPGARSLIHERLGTVMSGLRDLFKRRVNEKGRVSRRQSGASNRISGLESDTPFYEAAFVLYGRGRRRSRLRLPSLSGRLRRTATMDNKGKRDRPRSVLLPRNHDPFVSLENILCWQATDASCQKEERRGLLCTDVTRRNTITMIGPKAPVNFYSCYFTSPRTKEETLHGVTFVNPLRPRHTPTSRKIILHKLRVIPVLAQTGSKQK